VRPTAPISTEHGATRFGPELRVLIVGAGVAGLTLAALLRQRGFNPVVVELSPELGRCDNVVALWPSASNVLKGLGVFRRFEALATECARCVVADEQGSILATYSFASIADRYGPLVTLFRSDLLTVVRAALADAPIRFGVSLRALTPIRGGVAAVFSDGTADEFDVVVGSDGLHSTVRQLVFGDTPLVYTGLTGWSFSVPSPVVPPHEVVEYLGADRFVATYLVRDRVAVLMTARSSPGAAPKPDLPLDDVRKCFSGFGGSVPWLLGEMSEADAHCREDFHDVELDTWHQDRVILLGDAAHGSLPTNAMGAGLAMESAAVLAEELCRTDSVHVNVALDRFIERRRARVDHVRSQSRRVGKIIFGTGRLADLSRRGRLVDDLALDEFGELLAERI
jgi:2-polyprenyl-6-methoxyphenol hydroxylase-like FAD-dependent oxidoreductase